MRFDVSPTCLISSKISATSALCMSAIACGVDVAMAAVSSPQCCLTLFQRGRAVEDRIEFAIGCIDALDIFLDLELLGFVLGFEIGRAAQEGHRQRAVLLHVLHHGIERADVVNADLFVLGKLDVVLNDRHEEGHHHAQRQRKQRGDQQKLLRVAQAVQDQNRRSKQTLHASPMGLDIAGQINRKSARFVRGRRGAHPRTPIRRPKPWRMKRQPGA